MPRVNIAAQNAPGSLAATIEAGLALTRTAADASNLQKTLLTGKEMIIAKNTGVTSRTVTVSSVACVHARTGDVAAQVILGGVTRMFGPFPQDGWMQSDGYLYFQASHAEVVFSVIRLP